MKKFTIASSLFKLKYFNYLKILKFFALLFDKKRKIGYLQICIFGH